MRKKLGMIWFLRDHLNEVYDVFYSLHGQRYENKGYKNFCSYSPTFFFSHKRTLDFPLYSSVPLKKTQPHTDLPRRGWFRNTFRKHDIAEPNFTATYKREDNRSNLFMFNISKKIQGAIYRIKRQNVYSYRS